MGQNGRQLVQELMMNDIDVQPGERHMDIFDISSLPADLPSVTNIDEVYEYLLDNTSGIVTLTSGDRPCILSYNISHTEGLIYAWERYNYNYRPSTVDIPRMIDGLFSPTIIGARKLSDHPFTRLFITDEDMQVWLEMARRLYAQPSLGSRQSWETSDDIYANNTIPLHNVIDVGRLSMRHDPYMYVSNVHQRLSMIDTVASQQSQEVMNEAYIIQRVRDDNKIRAFNCALIWLTKGFNAGFNTPLDIEGKATSIRVLDDERYIQYRLMNGSPYPYINHTLWDKPPVIGSTLDPLVGDDRGVVIEILEYATNKFCAMLPLQHLTWTK